MLIAIPKTRGRPANLAQLAAAHLKCSAARCCRPSCRSTMASLKWARGWVGSSATTRAYASAACPGRSSSLSARPQSSSIWAARGSVGVGEQDGSWPGPSKRSVHRRCWIGMICTLLQYPLPHAPAASPHPADAALGSLMTIPPACCPAPCRTRARKHQPPQPNAAAVPSPAPSRVCGAGARSWAATKRHGVPAAPLPLAARPHGEGRSVFAHVQRKRAHGHACRLLRCMRTVVRRSRRCCRPWSRTCSADGCGTPHIRQAASAASARASAGSFSRC
jgi:hypothetical protein